MKELIIMMVDGLSIFYIFGALKIASGLSRIEEIEEINEMTKKLNN